MANYCSNCGSKLSGAERFCPSCGVLTQPNNATVQRTMPTSRGSYQVPPPGLYSRPGSRYDESYYRCPVCGGEMEFQTVVEHDKTTFGTVLLYILLCITILGILIVIPLLLRNKTHTVTYKVCQSCGKRLPV